MRIAIVMAAAMALGCGAASGRSSGDGGAADLAVPTGPEANPPKLGVIGLSSVFFTGVAQASVGASFSTYDGGVAGPCSLAVAGACRVQSCPRDSDLGSSVGGPMRTLVGAGMLTLTGPMGTMPLPENAAGGYTLTLGSALPWSGGESFTVASTGDVVPAFSVTLSAPSRPAISSPSKPASGPLTVTRASGLPIAWTASSPGTLTIDLVGATTTTAYNLECSVATSAGSYIVGADALAAIPTDATSLRISATASTVATVMAGDWPVTFTALDAANDAASGTAWLLDVTLQ